MMPRHRIELGLLLGLTACQAPGTGVLPTPTSRTPGVATYVGDYRGAHGFLEVFPRSYGHADVMLRMRSATSPCTGSVSGRAERVAPNRWVVTADENGLPCKLDLWGTATNAFVSEIDCPGHHGPACTFTGSLVRAGRGS